MITLSFLGLGQYDKETKKYSYKETTYSYIDQKDCETEITSTFIQKLWKKLYPESELFIVTTEKALQQSISVFPLDKSEYTPILIPESKNEEDLWEIFDIISDRIPNDESVVIDVTHGFRSFPIIVLSCCIYLKVTKKLDIVKIFYGAFESRSEENVTPVIDLTAFINIIEWSFAAREFLDKGDPRAFRDLLKKIQTDSHIFKKDYKVQKLSNLGSLLGEVYNSLSLVNIPYAFKNLKNMPDSIDKVTEDLLRDKSAKPFGMILQEINQRFETFTEKDIELFNDKGINAQLGIIQWYIDTQHYQQAVTLLSELIITIILQHSKKDPIRDRQEQSFREHLNEIQKKIEKGVVKIEDSDLHNLRIKLGELRNEINHAAMQKKLLTNDTTSPDTQIKNIKAYFEELKKLIGDYAS